MNEERKKREPAKEKRIGEITKDDIRVSFIGTIVSIDKNLPSIYVEDGSGSINVVLPQDFDTNKVEIGKFVRVIGLVAPSYNDESIEIKGEIIQDFSNLDKDIFIKYLKIKELNKEG